MSADLIQILIFAMVAAFVALRLISTFGRNPEDEQPTASDQFQTRRSSSNDRYSRDQTAVTDNPVSFLHVSPQVRQSLESMTSLDRGFDPSAFVDGARQAYEMILAAFWKGDRETLKTFVDGEVLDNFSAAIDTREAAEQTLSNRLVHLNKAEISQAEVIGRTANITVNFDADIISAVHDKDGNLIEGSISDTHNVKDSWTFSRELGSRDPNWVLIETATAE